MSFVSEMSKHVTSKINLTAQNPTWDIYSDADCDRGAETRYGMLAGPRVKYILSQRTL